MEARYVIFDLDDTLVHSDAVREAFGIVADAHEIDRRTLTRTLDGLPGRPAKEIFDALQNYARMRAAYFQSIYNYRLSQANLAYAVGEAPL